MGRLGGDVMAEDSSRPEAASQHVRPCPVCASIEHEILYRQHFEEFVAGSITDAYDVVACRQCGMCFASGLPDPVRFSEYYAQSSKYDLSAEGAEVSSFDSSRYKAEAAFLARHVPDRSGAVLDVGTATGELLAALRDEGFTSVHGVEPSPEAARRARDVHGLDVVAGDAQAASAWQTPFSVVSLVAVLEHLVDPATALRELANLLSPGGLLFLLVPDATRFSEHVDAPYQEFSVEHINYFTAASLRNLLTSIGMEVIVEEPIVVTQSADSNGPAIQVLSRRTDQRPPVRFDADGVNDLRRYIAASAAKEAPVAARIDSLADSQEPIYVWGTGTNALHLLASSRLAACNIVAFVDSNPHYSGRQLAGRQVLAPADLERIEAPILITSAISQTAIADAARTRFGPDVPLILLY